MLAVRELQDALGPVSVERLGPELGLMTADGLTIEEVAAHCESDPLVFVRHLASEVDRVRSHVGVAAARAIHYAELPDIGPEIAVQAWASGMPTIGFGAAEAAQEIVAALRDEGYQPVRAAAAYTLSCALVGSDAILGLNRRDAALCDWPGGKVRLGRTKEQVSRAEFKLEELLDVFDLRPARRRQGTRSRGGARRVDPDPAHARTDRLGGRSRGSRSEPRRRSIHSSLANHRRGVPAEHPGAVRRRGQRHADGAETELPDDDRRGDASQSRRPWRGDPEDRVTACAGDRAQLPGDCWPARSRSCTPASCITIAMR